jgi:hypothetical protein
MPSHQPAPAPDTTADLYSPSHTPELTVGPGNTIVVGPLDAFGYLERQKVSGQQRRMFALPRGYCWGVNGVLPDWILA